MTARILTIATTLLTQGADPIDAIEQACAQVATTEGARERARVVYLAMAAKVERGA